MSEMNSRADALSLQYAAALRAFLAHQQETLLQQAYDLGREAIENGLGVLDMAGIHHEALTTCLSQPLSSAEQTRVMNAAETFFMEALSPFEAAHRGFREANLTLCQLNAELERRGAELAATNRDLHELSSEIIHVQEEERKRISRELHDEIGQALTLLSLNLSTLKTNGGPQFVSPKLADMHDRLTKTMDTVHGFARELRPAMLDDLGLLPALRTHLKLFGERTGLRVRFRGSDGVEKLSGEQKTVLFRVAQESLTNVAKHAEATQVAVTLRTTKEAVRMLVEDDGKSFQVDGQLSATGGKRLGLLGMRERVRLVNGRFDIKSAPGAGTTVCVEIPF